MVYNQELRAGKEIQQYMKKNDRTLIIVLLLLAAGIFIGYRIYHRESGTIVMITVNGEEYAKLPLSKNTTFDIKGIEGENRIEIQDGTVNMIQADCPDKLCVHQKPIHYHGEKIICLPHKVVVEISGGEVSDLDGIAQ